VRLPLLGSRPLWRLQYWKSTPRGFTSPASFRLQAFSTSWRFAPPRTLRPCFMPLTPGVLPSELSPPSEPFRLSAVLALLSFTCRHLPSEEGRPSAGAAFRALLPSGVRCFQLAVTLAVSPLLSWDSSPLGFSPFPPSRMLPSSSPPALGSRPAGAFRPPGLQGFALRKDWLVSVETADPSGVSHLLKLAIGSKGLEDRDY
jgi:hypothetical protein